MILVKIEIKGKEVYETISFEDALIYPNKDNLVFTSDDEKEEFEEHLDELNDRIEELNDRVEEILDSLEELDDFKSIETRLAEIKDELKELSKFKDADLEYKLDSIDDELSEIEDELDEEDDEEEIDNKKSNDQGWHINFDGINEALNNIGNTVSSWFTPKGKSKSSRLVAALPFMDEEDIHEVVVGILNDSSEYKDLDLVSAMPFLSKDDCDALFMKYVVVGTNKSKCSIVSMAPFVSQTCLSHLVDEYISGKYPDLRIDEIYPFMSSKDVKRVFKYIISKDNN